MDTKQPEALQCAADLEYSIAHHGMQDAFTLNAYMAMKMVRTQHARITELEAARFAYASEFAPTSDGDPDVSSIHANIRALKAQLAQRFDAADMATAAAQGFRYGAASVDVAQERQTPEHIEAMQRAWPWMENQAEAQSKGGHATFDLMMLRDERDALRAAIDSYPPPALEGWKPTSEMRAVVAVAVTMLYDTHPEDVLRVFDLCELEKISIITMLLGSQKVEDIYRSAWDHLTAAHGPADGESNE